MIALDNLWQVNKKNVVGIPWKEKAKGQKVAQR